MSIDINHGEIVNAQHLTVRLDYCFHWCLKQTHEVNLTYVRT